MPGNANADLLTKFVSPQDLVAATGLSMATVHRALKNGELASRKVGRRRLIAIEDANAWIEGK